MPYEAGPFSEAHLYLQWGGKLPGNEQWSCGMRLYGTPGTAVADAATLLDDMTSPLSTFHEAANSHIASTAKLSFIKLNAIGTDGQYIEDTTNQTILADLAGGASAGAAHPNQVALVVSLTTGFSRGPAHRGRFYMPLPVIPVASDGLVSDSDRDQVQVTAAALLAGINATNATWKVGVFSRKLGAPGRRAVTGVEVGRVLDTQRRRRRSLVEGY